MVEKATAPFGRGFHDRAASVNIFFAFFADVTILLIADQREAPYTPITDSIIGKVFGPLSTIPIADQREADISNRLLLFHQPPIRPASIRTLVGAVRSGASWGPTS
jgi:hypothetical protein